MTPSLSCANPLRSTVEGRIALEGCLKAAQLSNVLVERHLVVVLVSHKIQYMYSTKWKYF